MLRVSRGGNDYFCKTLEGCGESGAEPQVIKKWGLFPLLRGGAGL